MPLRTVLHPHPRVTAFAEERKRPRHASLSRDLTGEGIFGFFGVSEVSIWGSFWFGCGGFFFEVQDSLAVRAEVYLYMLLELVVELRRQ